LWPRNFLKRSSWNCSGSKPVREKKKKKYAKKRRRRRRKSRSG